MARALLRAAAARRRRRLDGIAEQLFDRRALDAARRRDRDVVPARSARSPGRCVWLFLGENLLIGAPRWSTLDTWAEYLPFHALDAADGTGGDNLLSYWPGVLRLARWGSRSRRAGIWRTRPPRHHRPGRPTLRAWPPPVAKDQELELTIDSLAYGGNGVARLNGFVVFVRRGLPGDRVRARVTKVKRSHAEALATEVLEAGAERVDAPCAHYPACGGCRFQDLAYEAQLARRPTRSATRCGRIGGIADPPLEPIVPLRRSSTTATSSSTRSRSTRRARRSASTGRAAGTRCSRSRSAGYDRPRQRIRNAVRDWAREEGSRRTTRRRTGLPPPPRRPRGPEHGPGARAARDSGGRALRGRLLRRGAAPVPGGALGALGDQRHAGRGDEPADELLWGEDAIEEELCGLRFRVSPNAFLQTNTDMAERLYGIVAASSRGSPARRRSGTSTAGSARSA